ncbi:MAG: hypothetical protein IKS42_03505 [Oscillospiraceae bacterium]|nr:hypothetical protein [Oscillospiraceae bacterium]
MKKNMQDYNRVLGRVHISGRCREELLRAAAAGEQPRESRRVIMLDRALPALTGAAACLILLSCGGILLSGLREKRLEMQTASEAQTTAEHTQHSAETSTVQAAEATGTADREKEGIAYQTTLTEDADRAPLFVTTAAAEIITAAADTVTTTGETVFTTVEPQVSFISSATILQDTAATTSGSEAAVSTEETAQTEETTQTETEAPEAEPEYRMMILPKDVVSELAKFGDNITKTEFLETVSRMTAGEPYRLDDSLGVAEEWLEVMYANDLISRTEVLDSMRTIADGGRLSDSFIDYAGSPEVLKTCLDYLTYKGNEVDLPLAVYLRTVYPTLALPSSNITFRIAILMLQPDSETMSVHYVDIVTD